MDFIPYDGILGKDNFMLAVTPSGGHLEYFTGLKPTRWYTTVALDYIEYL